MPPTFTPEVRQQLLTELYQSLEKQTLQALRGAARLWGWPLRGTAKADITRQMAGYLGDRARMAEAIQTLSEEARELLGWITALNPSGDPAKLLQPVLALTGNRQITQKAVGDLIQDLYERCLVFVDAANRYFTPGIFREWLPSLTPSALHYDGPPATVPLFTLADFNQHVQHLLVSVELDRPRLAVRKPGQGGAYSPADRLSPVVSPRQGAVAPETLARWDYATVNEQDLAGFLLEQLRDAGLYQINPFADVQRLQLASAANEAWEALLPAERLVRLRQAWLLSEPQRNMAYAGTWNELDMALRDTQPYALRASYYWGAPEALYSMIEQFRPWLLNILQCLAPDVWHRLDGLNRLVYQLRRDPFISSVGGIVWRWYKDKIPLEPNQMDFETWQATYGQIVAACLRGPASWLLLVQVGYDHNRPVAFRRIEQIPAGDAFAIPADALVFPTEMEAVLRNIWQTGGLRRLLRRIAVETGRGRETTTYRVDVATFRSTLQSGVSAEQVGADSAAAGFPLPSPIRAILQAWQERAGRHQLYDQVGVIELSDDLGPEEARAIAGLGVGQLYQASPRCLVILNPDAVQRTVDELRRRGYTPQVIP